MAFLFLGGVAGRAYYVHQSEEALKDAQNAVLQIATTLVGRATASCWDLDQVEKVLCFYEWSYSDAHRRACSALLRTRIATFDLPEEHRRQLNETINQAKQIIADSHLRRCD